MYLQDNDLVIFPAKLSTKHSFPLCAHVVSISTVPTINYRAEKDRTKKSWTPSSAPRGGSEAGRRSSTFVFVFSHSIKQKMILIREPWTTVISCFFPVPSTHE